MMKRSEMTGKDDEEGSDVQNDRDDSGDSNTRRRQVGLEQVVEAETA